MGFVNTFTASGQGSLSLGGTQQVNEVASRVITLASLARTQGSAPHRRVYQQGWYGIGLTPGGGPLSGYVIIFWHKFVELECESQIFPSNGLPSCDTLYWDLDPGAVMYLEVDW